MKNKTPLFGAKLKEERLKTKLNREEVEKILRITNYYKFETGQRYPTELKTWIGLAHMFGWTRKKQGEMEDLLLKEIK